MLHRYSVAAAICGIWALLCLQASVQGRKAANKIVKPVISQYTEVLEWEELR